MTNAYVMSTNMYAVDFAIFIQIKRDIYIYIYIYIYISLTVSGRSSMDSCHPPM